jgi:hypothetical protein
MTHTQRSFPGKVLSGHAHLHIRLSLGARIPEQTKLIHQERANVLPIWYAP